MANSQVTQLLTTYLEKNCQLAGADSSVVQELVELALERDKKSLELFRKLIKAGTNTSPEKSSLHLVDLSQVKTFVDIGANKLSAVNFYGKKFPNLEQLIALDVTPQQRPFHFPQKSKYIQVEAEDRTISLASEMADVVQFRFVLHHLQSKEHIAAILKEAYRILKKNGRLLIWEETFSDNYTLQDFELATSNGIATDWELTQQFYQLTDQQKKLFIETLDWLINLTNNHMPWTGQYYAWNQWLEIIEPIGFNLKTKVNFGLRLNGKLKQGVQVFGEFIKR